MSEVILWAILALTLVNAGAILLFLFSPPVKLSQGVRKAVEDDLRKGREESAQAARSLREEVSSGLATLGESLSNITANANKTQQEQLTSFSSQLKELSESNNRALEQIRSTLDTRVKQLQEENEKKLEEMRKTVDEKLQGTLEKRLGESFKLVSERLEAVQRGLGEMQGLATGVGDLKTGSHQREIPGDLGRSPARGHPGAVSGPGAVREERADQRRVPWNRWSSPFALPGRPDDPNSSVWLPIDSKFPQEDYLRLQEAAESGDADGVQKAADALGRTLKLEAQKIQEKYLDPPGTTDFGIMFLATEGLYAEALRQPELCTHPPGAISHRHRRPHDAGRHPQQPPHGIPDPGHREAGLGGMGGPGGGEDGIREVRRRSGEGQEATQYGQPDHRSGRNQHPGHGAETPVGSRAS